MNKEERDKFINIILIDFIACSCALVHQVCDEKALYELQEFLLKTLTYFLKERNVEQKPVEELNKSWYLEDFNSNSSQPIKPQKESTIDSVCVGAILDFTVNVTEYITKDIDMKSKHDIANMLAIFTENFLKVRKIKDVYINNPDHDWDNFCDKGKYQLKLSNIYEGMLQ